MRISDLSSDVCSSDLLMSAAYVFVGSAHIRHNECVPAHRTQGVSSGRDGCYIDVDGCVIQRVRPAKSCRRHRFPFVWLRPVGCDWRLARSEEHTSELQSLMRISYAVFCLKKKTTLTTQT